MHKKDYAITVDESTGTRLYLLLKGTYDTTYIGNIMPGSSDPDVLAYACKDGRILITDDKDFRDFVFHL